MPFKSAHQVLERRSGTAQSGQLQHALVHSKHSISYRSFPRQCQHLTPRAVLIPEVASIASTLQSVVDAVTNVAPAQLQPAVQVIGGDVASVVALTPTLPGVARLTVCVVTVALVLPVVPDSTLQPLCNGLNPQHAFYDALQASL